ncbi:MAG: hypothetical protein J6B60_03405 [Clostridia bacterium]|nr:hypothetical protein [Clostridia bacterium]
MKKIISILILIVTLLALSSCSGDGVDVPEGMQLLSDNDVFTAFVPENWIIDDTRLCTAHDGQYEITDKYEAFYAQIQITSRKVEADKDIEAYANEYLSSFENNYGEDFEKSSGVLDFRKGTVSAGKEITFSIKMGADKDIYYYRVTFMKKGENIVEISYRANSVAELFENNLEDYEATRENIILK